MRLGMNVLDMPADRLFAGVTGLCNFSRGLPADKKRSDFPFRRGKVECLAQTLLLYGVQNTSTAHDCNDVWLASGRVSTIGTRGKGEVQNGATSLSVRQKRDKGGFQLFSFGLRYHLVDRCLVQPIERTVFEMQHPCTKGQTESAIEQFNCGGIIINHAAFRIDDQNRSRYSIKNNIGRKPHHHKFARNLLKYRLIGKYAPFNT